MDLGLFLNRLEKVLSSKKLKGTPSHIKLSPKINGQPYRPLVPSGETKKSSVLLLLMGKNFEDLRILFTLRSSYVQHHKHQISFPGGHCEGEEDVVATALREAEEEVGIETRQIRILGLLSELFVPPSKTLVVPVVAYSEKLNNMRANINEVDEIIIFPLSYFLNWENIEIEKWNLNGQIVDVPLWRIHPYVPLWGATAMILSEFIDIVKEIVQ